MTATLDREALHQALRERGLDAWLCLDRKSVV